jgi:dihydrofolate synthase/folylpolyglutamate synthase
VKINMTYDEIQAYLDRLQMHKIKLGLDAMLSFLATVDRPEKKLKFVHVAGTNGKGSVCASLSEILTHAGYRVGVYTSPHLSSVRERFRIGSQYIREEEFADLGTRICGILGQVQITYFEFTTALGLLWFSESDVDLVLLETGMGGRLDATNIVTPLISVITSISMDHEAYLGNSLTAVAGEKAGIIKEGVPVVSGATHPEAAAVIRRVSDEKKTPLFCLGQDFDYSETDDKIWRWRGGEAFGGQQIEGLESVHLSLVHRENAALAIAALKLLEPIGFKASLEDMRKGLTAVKWPGRMEYFEQPLSPDRIRGNGADKKVKICRYLLDGAHNLDGVNNLAKTLRLKFSYEKLIFIWGAMADKDLAGTLALIAPLADHLVFTQPDGERSASVEYIQSYLPDKKNIDVSCISDGVDALALAQEKATDKDLIVIGGSLYLVGAMRFLLLGDLV